MSKLIDLAVSDFSNREIRTLEMPEWETTLYAKNLTLNDKAKWLNRADNDTTDYLCYSVIFGVTDEAGESVFDIADKTRLRNNVDPELVSRMANFVLSVPDRAEADREKN